MSINFILQQLSAREVKCALGGFGGEGEKEPSDKKLVRIVGNGENLKFWLWGCPGPELHLAALGRVSVCPLRQSVCVSPPALGALGQQRVPQHRVTGATGRELALSGGGRAGAADGMQPPKPRLFAGALVPAGLASGGRAVGGPSQVQEGGERVILCLFPFEDVFLQHLCPKTLSWRTAIQRCFGGICFERLQAALRLPSSGSGKRPEKPFHSTQMLSRLQVTGGPCSASGQGVKAPL